MVVVGASMVVGWLLSRGPWPTRAGRRALRAAAQDVRDAEARRLPGRAPSARELMRAVAVRDPAELLAAHTHASLADLRFAQAVGVYPVPLQEAQRYSWEYGRWTPWWAISDRAGGAGRR